MGIVAEGKRVRCLEKLRLHSIGIVGIAAAFLLVSSCSYQWHFPTPTGAYDVGLEAISIVDSSRTDPLSPSKIDKRELLLWVWYPAVSDSPARPMGYLEKVPGSLEQFGSMLSISPRLFNAARSVVTHTYPDAPVADAPHGFPVLLFSHGIGIGTIGQNMVQFEELASRGYIIVSIGHTYESAIVHFPDGRVALAHKERWQQLLEKDLPYLSPLKQMRTAPSLRQDSLALVYVNGTPILDSAHISWTVDTRFVIDRLFAMRLTSDSLSVFSHMDLARLGIFGHSMGGMVAQKMSYEDPRISAGISYDAPPIREALSDTMTVPFLFMNCEEFGASSAPAFQRSVPGTGYAIIKGAKHFNFCDLSLWTNTPFWRIIGFSGSIDGYRMENILNEFTVGFFDKHLNSVPVDLTATVAKYPEVNYREKPALPYKENQD